MSIAMKTPPINKFFNHLQNWSVQEKSCHIVYRQNDGSAVQLNAVIVDLFSWQGSQYVLMEKGQLIRLDRIVSVDGITALS